MHEWAPKFDQGVAGEYAIDRVLKNLPTVTDAEAKSTFGDWFLHLIGKPGFTVSPATGEEQRQGIDRHFSLPLTVEYKTDATAVRTHNAFIETVSVDTAGKRGWAYTSEADVLVYYIPGDELLYIVRFSRLRARLPHWLDLFPSRRIPNRGYHTVGLLVPLEELEECADVVISV